MMNWFCRSFVQANNFALPVHEAYQNPRDSSPTSLAVHRFWQPFGMCLPSASAFHSPSLDPVLSVCLVAGSLTYSTDHVLHSFHKLSYTCWSDIAGCSMASKGASSSASVQRLLTVLGFHCNTKRLQYPYWSVNECSSFFVHLSSELSDKVLM